MLLAASPASARAQRVHGTVRDSLTGIPIAGAVVWLADSAGAFLARSIGDETGKFTVMRLAGATRLHVVHIGFHPRDILLARDGSDSTRDVRLEALPPNLATVSASTSRVSDDREAARASSCGSKRVQRCWPASSRVRHTHRACASCRSLARASRFANGSRTRT